jgi:outer membrane autotransporter protein
MSYARICAVLGAILIGVLMLTAPRDAEAQGYCQLAGPPCLLTVTGYTTAQLTMAQSIDSVCPHLASGTDLATICGTMIGTASVLQGGGLPMGLSNDTAITSISGLKNALSQLNGGMETVVPTSQASVLRNLQSGALTSRLSVLHTRMLGGDNDGPQNSVLAMNDGATAQDAPGHILLAQNSPTDISMWRDKLGLFVNAIGQFGSSDATGRQNGYDFNNEGFLMGADYRLRQNFILGVAFGYTHSSTDFDASPDSAPGQYLHGNLFQGSVYASYYPTDALYIDASATIGGGNNDSQRHVVIPGLLDRTASGSFGTRTYGASLGGGYAFPIEALTLTPTARFEFRRMESDSFTETGGSGVDLTYGNSQQNAVLTFLGGQAQYAISTSFGVVSPTAKFEWAHQYNRGNTTIGVAYSNDPTLLSTFTLAGEAPSRNYYDLGVGVALQLANNWSGFVNYDAILGVSHTSFNSFTAGVRFSF